MRPADCPRGWDRNYQVDQLLTAMRLDKKARNGKLRFVLLKRLGETVVTNTVTDADIEEAVNVSR